MFQHVVYKYRYTLKSHEVIQKLSTDQIKKVRQFSHPYRIQQQKLEGYDAL